MAVDVPNPALERRHLSHRGPMISTVFTLTRGGRPRRPPTVDRPPTSKGVLRALACSRGRRRSVAAGTTTRKPRSFMLEEVGGTPTVRPREHSMTYVTRFVLRHKAAVVL